MNSDKNWRENITSANEGNLFILENKILTDVIFIFPDSNYDRIYAHKIEMAKASNVFQKMFFDKPSIGIDEVIIKNIKKNNFYEMVKFCYADQLNLTMENVNELFNLAKIYKLHRLENRCESFLEKSVCDVKNFWKVFETFNSQNFSELQENCFSLIKRDTLRYLQSDFFTKISKNLLKKIMEVNEIDCREFQLFENVMRWAEIDCKFKKLNVTGANKRIALGDLIYLIHFPAMTCDEFGRCTTENGLLSSKEIEEILRFISTKQKNTGLKFSTENRSSLINELTGQKECVIGLNHRYTLESFRKSILIFSVNKRIYLNGIQSFCSKATKPHSLIISDEKNTKIVELKNQRNYPVMLVNPIILNPNKSYSIEFIWITHPTSTIHTYQDLKSVYRADGGVKFNIIKSMNARVEKIFFKEFL